MVFLITKGKVSAKKRKIRNSDLFAILVLRLQKQAIWDLKSRLQLFGDHNV